VTNPNYTHIAVLLDRSGSMQAIKSDTEGGFTAFIDQQRATPGRCDVTLAQFDDVYEEVYTGQPLASVPPLVLHPRGMTALLDGIGRLISTTGERLAGMPEAERPGSVLLVIMTDGLENASKEFTLPTVRKLITDQSQTYGWTFVYLGANQDAIAVGQGLGVSPGMAMTYGGEGTAHAMRATSANFAAYRATVASGGSVQDARKAAEYTDDQRAEADASATAQPGTAQPGPPTKRAGAGKPGTGKPGTMKPWKSSSRPTG
jgi:hypothetical protein